MFRNVFSLIIFALAFLLTGSVPGLTETLGGPVAQHTIQMMEPEVRGANKPEANVEVSLFWQPGCPYCLKAKKFLNNLDPSIRSWLEIKTYDVSSSEQALELFVRANAYFDIKSPVVPLIIIGNTPLLGYEEDETTGRELLANARACRRENCAPLKVVLAGLDMSQQGGSLDGGIVPRALHIPLLGEVDVGALSLPALTVVMGALDGFNPCALWVLVFLISLLLGMQDRLRMWLLGGAFLITSGLVYFVFLAAWLNLFLLLGAILWVRLAVGVVAIGSGVYYLWEFTRNAAAECKVTNPGQRQRIMEAFSASVNEKRFLAALAGVIVLAVAVNLIELLCSAGIPAVYTEVLAMNVLPAWQYYSYLLLYVAVFIIDDISIFALAMLTLTATGLTNRYLRVSHFIGGAVMLMIGLLLLFAPDWLTFAA